MVAGSRLVKCLHDVTMDPDSIYSFSDFDLSCLGVMITERLSWIQAAPDCLAEEKKVPFSTLKRSFLSISQQIGPNKKRVT